MAIFHERKDTKGLEMQTEYFERLTKMSDCGMVVARMQAEPEIIYANDYFYQILQYDKKEFAEKFDNMIMGPVLEEEKQKVKALMARQAAMGGDIHLEFRVTRKDGAVIWTSFTAKRDDEPESMIYCCSYLDISASKRHLEDVYNAKRELDLIANSIPGGVVKIRMNDMQLLYANDGFFRLAGYSRSEYSAQFHNDCSRLIHPDDIDMANRVIRQALENRGPLGLEYRIVAKNGEVRWSYINGTRIDDDHGQAVYLCVIVDITSRKHAEAKLADNNYRSKVITKMLRETIWTYDLESGVLRRDGDLEKTYSPESVLENQFADEQIKKMIHPEDTERFIKLRDLWLSKPGEQKGMFRVRNSQGVYENMMVNTYTEAKQGDKPSVVYGLTRLLPADENVAEEKLALPKNRQESGEGGQLERKLKKIARSARAKVEDNITGLLPYASFLRKTEELLTEHGDESQYALICADINEFQSISHHYGFYISNRILKAFSDVLLKHLAKDGMCARVDGDYFVVLFQYKDHKELVKAMAAVVRHQHEMEREEDNLEFGSTVGVYLIPQGDYELLGMLEKADLARRSIKGLRGNHYAIYTEEMEEQLSREDEMVVQIRRAMEERSVEVNYLPRIGGGDKDNVIGCKVIPRILMKDGQYCEYKQIMHLMERGARLEEFNFSLLREVTDNIGAWKARGNTVIPVSIEMTASQLSTKHAVSRIHNMVVTRNNLSPQDFLLEIPERFFADATTAFEMAIRELSDLGYQIVISRFGADHTAINSMRRLPVSGIKFHGEYFSEHMINEKDAVILKKTVEMAEDLGLMVYCGGIHTKLQEEFAKRIGCKIFEGDIYYGAMKNVVFEKCFLDDVSSKGEK